MFSLAIEEVNDMLSSNAGYREVRAMGWLSEQVHLGGDSSHTEWKPVFVALTEKDMLLYVAAPWSRDDWSAPVMSHPLLATRWSTLFHYMYVGCDMYVNFTDLGFTYRKKKSYFIGQVSLMFSCFTVVS